MTDILVRVETQLLKQTNAKDKVWATYEDNKKQVNEVVKLCKTVFGIGKIGDGQHLFDFIIEAINEGDTVAALSEKTR